MTNPYYNPSGVPAQGASVASPAIRTEYAAIQTAFDKLPTLAGNAYKVLRINGGETAIEASGLTIDVSGRLTAPAGLTVSGGTLVTRGITDNATATALTLSGDATNTAYFGSSATFSSASLEPRTLVLSSDGAGKNDLIIRRSVAGSYAGSIAFARSRGNAATPTTLINGDATAYVFAYAYDGTNYQNSASIYFDIDNTVAAGKTPGRITLSTANFSTGTSTAAFQIDSAQLCTALKGLTVSGGAFTSRGVTDNATAAALTLSGSGANWVTIANSATNPTISTSVGDLQLSSASNVVRILSTASPSVLAFQVNTTEYGRISVANTGDMSLITGTLGIHVGLKVLEVASADRYVTVASSFGGNPKIGTSDGQLTLGTGSALATNATVGHLCIPTCAGTPTGVPTGAGAGNLPIIYDTTNNFLYIYNGGWKKSTVYA